MTRKNKDAPELPNKCVCGRVPVVVRTRGGRMLSCPDPAKCPGNLRTMWRKSEIEAVKEWNGLVAEAIARQKG